MKPKQKKNWPKIVGAGALLTSGVVLAIWFFVTQDHLSGVTLSVTATPSIHPLENTDDQPARPSASPTASPTMARVLNAADQKKLEVLKEILASKNDNDPRMDTQLIFLSPELKAAMKKEYEGMRPEARNERGTIAFLIGREIKNDQDVEFLESILMEKPCLSLSDCSKSQTAATTETEHLESTNETTANYPQLMALRQMVKTYKQIVSQDAQNPEAARILKSLKAALNSPNPRVSDEARRSLQALGKE